MNQELKGIQFSINICVLYFVKGTRIKMELIQALMQAVALIAVTSSPKI